MQALNAAKETDRGERKVWWSLCLSECPVVAWKRRLQEENTGLPFGGLQDAAALINPSLGRVLWRWGELQSCCQLHSWFLSAVRGLTAGEASLCAWGLYYRAGDCPAWLFPSPEQGCWSQVSASCLEPQKERLTKWNWYCSSNTAHAIQCIN